MDLKSNPDAKLLHAIHNILLKEWDPLGIRRMPSMRDEYDDYLPNIFKLIRDNSSESEIFEYLWWIELKVLEKTGRKEHTLKIAKLLKEIEK
ncbi:hypothetical protein F7P75_07660 [Acinetobacter gandensis]|jgi:hypothetical protein|uniref:DUF1871 domain-containing protein n=1 Tax=Acinetobacter gandensis TaxID=1443941 RepID=A0A1A7RE88_9GAMM|nr:hypothetical protein [Acinetobacter gandensis]KAB0627305.1 hypothetical protein F7P75_07660 [Acinetobacter gandensis]OBX29748.1 hypothetical protein A9J31_11570 [Acinetobacter gandensis]